jgi:hypothetical protein
MKQDESRVRRGSLSRWRLAEIRTAAELRAAGRSAAEIETLLRRGTLIQIRRGVYASADEAARARKYRNGDRILRAAAALAAIGPGAAASHQTSASIHSWICSLSQAQS